MHLVFAYSGASALRLVFVRSVSEVRAAETPPITRRLTASRDDSHGGVGEWSGGWRDSMSAVSSMSPHTRNQGSQRKVCHQRLVVCMSGRVNDVGLHQQADQRQGAAIEH